MFTLDKSKRVYLKYCAECHGNRGQGNSIKYPNNPYVDLLDDQWKHTRPTRRDLAKFIRYGYEGLHRYDLSDEEIKLIIDYIKKQRKNVPR